MDLIKFEDFLSDYNKINSQEWVTIYESYKNNDNEIKHDIFTFCALLDKDDEFIKEYMQHFEWEFSPDSFGHSYFEQVSRNIGNGEFKDEIYFISGDRKSKFEYLVAHRYFNKKYSTQIDINPKLIWYNNLVKVGDNYVDPVSDEVVIKTAANKVEVLTVYLKDFLCAHNKLCVIAFDHRRFALLDKAVKNIQEVTCSDSSYILYTLNTHNYDDYNVTASIIGKVIIKPYKECQHNSLKYLIDKEEFAEFIYAIDEDNGKPLTFTCDEDRLANYFGANPDAPHFLTPIFFNKTVLNKYKTDTANYTISDGLIRYLDEWIIPFTINDDDKVVVWLGDLGRIPFSEQKHWSAENIPPKGVIEENFWRQQMEAVFVDKILPEKWLFSLLEQVNKRFTILYGDVIFYQLSEADKHIYSAFMTPVTNSIDEYKEYLMQFCKITAERINTTLIKEKVGDTKLRDEQGKLVNSINQLSLLFSEFGIASGERLIVSLKKVYNSRNKLAGHSASLKEYNKVWKRNENYSPNWIADSKILLNAVNDALNGLVEELK